MNMTRAKWTQLILLGNSDNKLKKFNNVWLMKNLQNDLKS